MEIQFPYTTQFYFQQFNLKHFVNADYDITPHWTCTSR